MNEQKKLLEIQRYIQQQREKQKSFPKSFRSLFVHPEHSDGIWWNDVMEARAGGGEE